MQRQTDGSQTSLLMALPGAARCSGHVPFPPVCKSLMKQLEQGRGGPFVHVNWPQHREALRSPPPRSGRPSALSIRPGAGQSMLDLECFNSCFLGRHSPSSCVAVVGVGEGRRLWSHFGN